MIFDDFSKYIEIIRYQIYLGVKDLKLSFLDALTYNNMFMYEFDSYCDILDSCRICHSYNLVVAAEMSLPIGVANELV